MDTTTRPHVLICDVGDTLIRWVGYSREDGLDSLRSIVDPADRFDLDALVRTGVALDDTIEPRAAELGLEYRQADFLRLLFARHGMQIHCDDDNLEWHYWHHALRFEPEPGVLDAVERIAGLGVRLGVLSNTAFGPVCLRRELAGHGLERFFQEPVVTSARFSLRKPDPAIFHAARGLLAAPSEIVWYVGNSVYHDVGGANRAGMPVVWYNEDGERLADQAQNGESPDREVACWTDLAQLMAELQSPEADGAA